MVKKATGIVRKVDELGRVVIPIEVRRTLGISERDPLEIYTGENGEIILKKYHGDGCQECGEVGKPLKGKVKICRNCLDELGGYRY